MKRTQAREIAIQLGFSLALNDRIIEEAIESFFDQEYYKSLGEEDELFSEYPSKKQIDYISALATGTTMKRLELDGYIEKYSKGWKLSRISPISTAIMRTAIFEVLYMDDVPAAVAINEAVELAKGYEEKETVSFINGILGSFMREEQGEEIAIQEISEEAQEKIED